MADGGKPERDAGSPAHSAGLPPEIEARLASLRELIHADCNHYQLLGVPRHADRKAIKKAYYDLAVIVHPDRHAGRDLAAWKPLMEALFRHVTLAHDVLGDPEARAAYDRTLPPPSAPPPPRVATPPATPPRVVTPPATAPRVPTPPPRVATPPRVPTPPATPLSSSAPATPQPGSRDRAALDTARRDALARRLLAGRHSMRRVEAPPQEPLQQEPAPTIVEKPAPDSATLRAEAEAAEFRGEFTKATKSWRMLAVLEPASPDVAQRTARALLSSKDASLHEAAELAKKAVAAAPHEVKNHLLLAEIYLEAQLPSAARGVLTHAITLGNGVPQLNALLAKVEMQLKPPRK